MLLLDVSAKAKAAGSTTNRNKQQQPSQEEAKGQEGLEGGAEGEELVACSSIDDYFHREPVVRVGGGVRPDRQTDPQPG